MTPRAWKRLFARSVLWAGIVLGLVLLFFVGRATWSVYTKERVAAEAHANEAQALAELTARQKSLSAQMGTLDTPQGMEAEVRERYKVAKTGEEVIVLTDNPNAGGATTTPRQGLWEHFLSWFSWF